MAADNEILHHNNEETEICFLCNTNILQDEPRISLFEKRLQEAGVIEYTLADNLSAILDKHIQENETHSNFICISCNDTLVEFEEIEQRYLELRRKIISDYHRALRLNTMGIADEGHEVEIYLSANDVMEHSMDVQQQENIENVHIKEEFVDESIQLVESHPEAISDKPNEENTLYNSVDLMTVMSSGFESEMKVLGNGHYYEHGFPSDKDEIMQEDVHYEQIVENSIQTVFDESSLDEQEDDSRSETECINENIDNTLNGDNSIIKDHSDLLSLHKGVPRRTKIISKYENDTPFLNYDGGVYTCLLCHSIKEDSHKGEEMLEKDAKAISLHLKALHNIRIHICEVCGEYFRKKVELSIHMDDNHDNAKAGGLSCEICNAGFPNLKLLRAHRRTHYNSNKQYECPECSKKYSSKNLLDEHMNMHTGNRPYKCNYCPKDFASKYTLTAHLKIHSDRPRPYVCRVCSKAFFSTQNLQQHIKTHSGVKEFICEICHKAFGTSHNLEVHKVVHTGYKPYICRTCGKAFARRAEIRDHERTHTGEKPFKCDMCNMSFAQRSNLTTHKRATHLNDRRYKCEICERSFKRRRLLDYHMSAAHTGERPYKCDICNATFVYPEHHKKHLRIHTGVKPYACEVCGKTFNSRDNRNAHRFIHSDKKPYECLVCGQGFMRKPLLFTHMQQSGHVKDTIIVNQPRLDKTEVITEYAQEIDVGNEDFVEEHLIIDGPVQIISGDSDVNILEPKIEDNEVISSDAEDEIITPDHTIFSKSGEYIKTEDGDEVQFIHVERKNLDGSEKYTWMNVVT